MYFLPLPDSVQDGFEEVQKLNQQNNQLSQCTAETAAGTSTQLEIIEEAQKTEIYREIKDDDQQAVVEEETREKESTAELLQITEEVKKEEEERLQNEEGVRFTDENQLAAPDSSEQNDKSITATPERYILDFVINK